MPSLQRRLHLGLAASLVLLMVLVWWLMGVIMQHLTEEYVSSRLSHDSDSVLSALTFTADGTPQVTLHDGGGIYHRAYSGHYFVLRQGTKEPLRSRSLWDYTLDVPLLAAGESRRWRAIGPAGQRLLLQAGGFRKQGRVVTIMVAEDLTPLFERLRQLDIYFALLTGVVLLVLIGVQRTVVRSSLRGLQRVREDVRRLEQGEIGQLSQQDVPTEIRPLVEEVNRLLSLLGQRLQRSRNAFGNLAHAIKGPVSLLMQLTTREELQEHPQLVQELNEQITRIHQLMERELKRARLAGKGTPGRLFNAAEEVPVLLDVLQRIHREKTLHMEQQLSGDAIWRVDRDDMLELLGNLLDNASKWAKERVRCSLQNDHRLCVIVEDDGPGCSDEQLQQLTGRGVRIDEAVSGHGLGLAIVRDIVDLYGGELSFGRSTDLGGLKVQVCLPLQETEEGQE